MAEPNAVAEAAEEVVPGVWRWGVANERIGGAESTGHAVAGPDGAVLVDPVRLAAGPLAALGPVSAILLTAQCHQRSSWRYRRELGAPVWAPAGTRPMEEEPDERYSAGDLLPGGLRAVHTPGPEDVHFSFVLERGPRVLFCSDLLTNYAGRGLRFVPLEIPRRPRADPPHRRRPPRARLLRPLPLDHGSPIAADPKAAMRDLLARTA